MTAEELVHQAVVDMRVRQGQPSDATVVLIDVAEPDKAAKRLASLDLNNKNVVVWLVGTPWRIGPYYHRLKTQPVSVAVSDYEALFLLQSGAKLWLIDDIPVRVSRFPFYGQQRHHFRWRIVMVVAHVVAKIKEAAIRWRKNGTSRSM